MNPKDKEKERRHQRACERLGAAKPLCVSCGESNPHCLENHHIAGWRHDKTVALICRNCHRKLSDAQKDHPKSLQEPPSPPESAGYFLLGLADFLALLIDKLREFGSLLISGERSAESTRDGGHCV